MYIFYATQKVRRQSDPLLGRTRTTQARVAAVARGVRAPGDQKRRQTIAGTQR